MKLINRIRDMLGIQRTNTRSDAEVDELIRKSIEKTSRDQRERAGRRRHHRRGTRMFAMVLAAALPLSAITSEPLTAYADDSFDSFMENEWKEYVENDYTAMHSCVKDYKAMGLKKPEVTLGDISYEEIEKDLEENQKSLDKLHEFDFDSLSESQQHDYLVYEEYLECLIGMDKYPDMIEMFRPVSGMMTQAKEYLEDFALYTEEDLEDYLVLLKDYAGFIDQMIAFTSEQAEKGYFLDNNSLDTAVSEINDFADAGDKNEMIVVFSNTLDQLDWLDDAKKAEYEKKNREIIINELIPAYRRASEALKGMRGSRQYGGAVCDYPDGKEYYEWLARYNCSTSETVQEKFDFISGCIDEAMSHYRDLLRKNPSFESESDIEGLETLDEVIDYLRSHMDGFPEGPDVSYKLEYLDESVAESAMAYYIPSPVDDINENVIHVNKDSVKEINTLYFTLAHEGFPGHLYQMTWYQNAGGSKMRQELSIMGYQEGWANYVERIMLRRAPLDAVSAEYIACDEFISYMLNTGADLAVNGLGYNVKELGEWLGKIGLDKSFAKEMYSYSVENPGLLLPYGYGEAKFWDLDGRTRSALGENFDDEEFHLQLLTNGPRQFELVEQDVSAYVESKGGTLPDQSVMFADEKYTETESGEEQSPKGQNRHEDLYSVLAVLLLAVLAFLLIWRSRKKKTADLKNDEDTVVIGGQPDDSEEHQDTEQDIE